MSCASEQRGFTLLEVVIAVAVVALGLAAAFSTVSQTVFSATRLQQKTLANWVAQNELVQLRIAGEYPNVGRANGEVDFAGRTWRWERAVTATEVENLRRIDFGVALAEDPDYTIQTVIAFIGPGTPPTPARGWSTPVKPPTNDPNNPPTPPSPDPDAP